MGRTHESAPSGLVYVSSDMPGIRRVRRGPHFAYRLPDGHWLRDQKALARIRSLAIPPAYVDVWICPLPDGHLQATGRDARGRKQYRYHADWQQARDADKFERMATRRMPQSMAHSARRPFAISTLAQYRGGMPKILCASPGAGGKPRHDQGAESEDSTSATP